MVERGVCSAPMRNLDVALDALAKGIAPVPCRPGTKIPLVAWKPWQTELPKPEVIERLFADARVNVAVVCTGRIIFDCDEFAKAEKVLAECGPTPHVLKPPRGGIHLGYRRRMGVALANVVKIKGQPIDIRTDGGLEVLPPSKTEDGEYRWIDTDGLPATDALPDGNIGWTRERVKRTVSTIEPLDESDRMVRRAAGWTACVEGAVSGQRGHSKLFRVVCKLLHPPPRGFGLTVEQAWPILLAYNATCEPPFSVPELSHKCADAMKKAN